MAEGNKFKTKTIERLDEPFVTAGSVTGDMGVQNLCKPNAIELARFC